MIKIPIRNQQTTRIPVMVREFRIIGHPAVDAAVRLAPPRDDIKRKREDVAEHGDDGEGEDGLVGAAGCDAGGVAPVGC